MGRLPPVPSRGSELNNLSGLLSRALPAVQKPADAFSVLSLGCGGSRETRVLKSHAARISGLSERDVDFTGVDLRDPQIRSAREEFADATTRFIAADASRAGAFAAHGPADLVFLRHQNFWHSRDLWHRIFDNGLAQLSPDGHLVITSYFDEEHLMAVRALSKAGAELVADIRNPHAIPLHTPGKAVDKRMAVFRRPS